MGLLSDGKNSMEPDHLRSLFVSAGVSGLFIGNLCLSFMIAHQLYLESMQYLLAVTLLTLLVPYTTISAVLIHGVYGTGFLSTQSDVNPLYILCGVSPSEGDFCSPDNGLSRKCMIWLNFIIKRTR